MVNQQQQQQEHQHAGQKRQTTLDDAVESNQQPNHDVKKQKVDHEGEQEHEHEEPSDDDKQETRSEQQSAEKQQHTKQEDDGDSTAKATTSQKSTTNDIPVDKEAKKEEEQSPVLEKGLIYFFYRPKVDLDKIESVVDAQRTYMILRPLPVGAKLESKSVAEEQPIRFIELPKKELPSSGDRFAAFVTGDNTLDAVRKRLAEDRYSTKTQGERVLPAARPMGEGVYAIAHIQNTSHLVYQLTLPEELGETQEKFGIQEKGAFVLSTKNPESKSGGNQLPGNADFPADVQEEFGSRSWLPTKPVHLDYADASFLLIGESDEKAETLDKEELHHVVQDIHDQDARRADLDKVFTELGLSTKEHKVEPLLSGDLA
ncbi:hypothetical protein PYCC9005_000193 [Savitreella phatthalungensis]